MMCVMAGETMHYGDTVLIRQRTWKERLFSIPWRPMQKREAVKVRDVVLKFPHNNMFPFATWTESKTFSNPDE